MSPVPQPHGVIFFETPDQLRDWFDEHHATRDEVWLGFHRKASGLPTLTWQEAVAEALCVGWIDGIRYRLDDTSSAQRYTPRRKGSTWSALNVRTANELIASGRMRPAGLAAFEARDPERTAIYSYEREVAFDPDMLERFQADAAAWSDFQARSPSYRRSATDWVMSAKRPETRVRRLATLIADSAAGRRLRVLG